MVNGSGDTRWSVGVGVAVGWTMSSPFSCGPTAIVACVGVGVGTWTNSAELKPQMPQTQEPPRQV
jgi:hypothetical protein